jgi:hypothetical protein
MTPELQALIANAVGPDVDSSGFAVFEAVALNSKPLPGKNGTIFEQAMVMPITLQQMADQLARGDSVPLISDHQRMGEPKGRAFYGEVNYNPDSADLELRALFYLDPTEETLIAKLNAGSLDEVSVSFLSTELLCSDCGWDYFGAEGTSANLYDRTCGNGHTIGADGVHAQLVGLNNFRELSLVARGAAYQPRIVGKSHSKLQPTNSMRLAAKGFEIDGLFCEASLGEELVTANVDTTKLFTDLVAATASVTTLTASETVLKSQLADAGTQVAERDATIATLQTELAAAKAEPTNEADYQVALGFLGEVLTKVLVASGAEAPAELPKTVAELKAAIEDKTAKLTAILPVGGAAAAAAAATEESKPVLIHSAFSNRKFGN